MSLVSKFRRGIDLHFGIKLGIMGSLDKMQHVLKVKIHQNPVGRNGIKQLFDESANVIIFINYLKLKKTIYYGDNF